VWQNGDAHLGTITADSFPDSTVTNITGTVGEVTVTDNGGKDYTIGLPDSVYIDTLTVGSAPDSFVTEITAGNGIVIGETAGNDYTISTDMTAWKSHRVADTTFTANTWTDIRFDLKIANESLKGCSFYKEGEALADSSIIVVSGFNDIFYVGGCVHYDWTGSAGTSCTVYTRILYSTDDGSNWSEARCLQANNSESRGLNAEVTQSFQGTLYVEDETWIKLQVRVSDANMELSGDTVFDNPVAATLHLHNIGDNE
jgi:hypothetical protein